MALLLDRFDRSIFIELAGLYHALFPIALQGKEGGWPNPYPGGGTVAPYAAGSLPSLWLSPGGTSLLPEPSSLIVGLQLLPMTLLWGALEEFGWRGFLLRELARLTSGVKASVIVGFLWGLCHAPQVFYSSLPYDGVFREAPFLGASLWIAATAAFGCVLGWLQLQTGSFVPPALAHALINVLGSLAEGGDAPSPVWAGTGGLAAIFATALLATLLFVLRPPEDETSDKRGSAST